MRSVDIPAAFPGVSAVILAGGQSRRLGENKALLTLDGSTFLDRIAGQLTGFDEVLLSVSADDDWPVPFKKVVDPLPGLGPIGGLYAALCACSGRWLLALGCDIPLFDRRLAAYLVSGVSDACQAVVAQTGDGHLQPLCAVYKKSAAAVLKRQIDAGDRRLDRAVWQMRTRVLPLRDAGLDDRLLFNVNTPRDYDAVR